jgi:type I restriction enzyme M protein
MLMNYARVCNPYSGFFAPVNGTSATECAEKASFSGLSRHVLHYGLGIKDGRKIEIFHLAPNGKIGLVLANGALSTQSSGEGEIRKNIINDDLIEGIVAMPTQLFYSVTIPVTLWFITKNKKQKGKTVFIDARKMGHMVDRKHRDFTDEDIQKLADTFSAFQNGTLEDVKGFCAVVTTQDIAKQDYILTPGRYVGIEEQEDDGEPFEEKMDRLTSELSDMFKKSHELEDEIRKKLGAIGYEI